MEPLLFLQLLKIILSNQYVARKEFKTIMH